MTRIIKACSGYFDIIRIVDGGSTDGTVEAAKRLGCKVYQNQWADDLSLQFNFLLKKSNVGEWILLLADDEEPSRELLTHLPLEVQKANEVKATHFEIPMMVIQDNIPQQNIVEFTEQVDGEGFGDSGKFFMKRFILYDGKMRFEGLTHCGFPDSVLQKSYRTRYPILHHKDIDSWIVGDLWPAFINPVGHGIEEDVGKELIRLCRENKIRKSTDIIPVFKQGLREEMKEFLWKHRWPDGTLAHWWMIYFLKYHPEQLPKDFDYTEDLVSRRYLTLMKGHNNNLPVQRMQIHPFIKKYLLDIGSEVWNEL